MSSIVNKVKEVLHSDHKSSAPEGTHGPHSSRTANAADPRIDSDLDNREALGSHDGTYSRSDNYAIGGTQGANRTAGSSTTTAGPHSSNLANKADPRVDSDADGSRNLGLNSSKNMATGTAGTGSAFSSGTTGNTGAFGTTGTRNTDVPEGTVGPHSSRMANAADPRVDSDLDSGRNTGITGTHTSTTGTHGNTGAFGTTGTRNTDVPEGTFGPHSSRMANAADPRVDSDLDSGRNTGITGTHGNTEGYGSVGATHTSGVSEGTSGPHSSRIANAADRRVDSDLDSGRNTGLRSGTDTTGAYGTTGTSGTSGSIGGVGGTYAANDPASTGPAPNVAGPHKSDLLNKVDPRVDSDLDGSKTFGGNKTFSQS